MKKLTQRQMENIIKSQFIQNRVSPHSNGLLFNDEEYEKELVQQEANDKAFQEIINQPGGKVLETFTVHEDGEIQLSKILVLPVPKKS